MNSQISVDQNDIPQSHWSKLTRTRKNHWNNLNKTRYYTLTHDIDTPTEKNVRKKSTQNKLKAAFFPGFLYLFSVLSLRVYIVISSFCTKINQQRKKILFFLMYVQWRCSFSFSIHTKYNDAVQCSNCFVREARRRQTKNNPRLYRPKTLFVIKCCEQSGKCLQKKWSSCNVDGTTTTQCE